MLASVVAHCAMRSDPPTQSALRAPPVPLTEVVSFGKVVPPARRRRPAAGGAYRLRDKIQVWGDRRRDSRHSNPVRTKPRLMMLKVGLGGGPEMGIRVGPWASSVTVTPGGGSKSGYYLVARFGVEIAKSNTRTDSRPQQTAD